MDGSRQFPNPNNPHSAPPPQGAPWPPDAPPPWGPPPGAPPAGPPPPMPPPFSQPPPNFPPNQFHRPPPNPGFRQRTPDFNSQKPRFGSPDGGVRQSYGPGYPPHGPNMTMPPNFAPPHDPPPHGPPPYGPPPHGPPPHGPPPHGPPSHGPPPHGLPPHGPPPHGPTPHGPPAHGPPAHGPPAHGPPPHGPPPHGPPPHGPSPHGPPPPNHMGNMPPPMEQSTSGKVEMYQERLKALLTELEQDKKVSQSNEDQAWVNEFMKSRDKDAVRKSSKAVTKLSVPEYRSLLRQSLQLQQELQQLHTEMSEQIEDADESSWQTKLHSVHKIKMELQSLKETLTDTNLLAYIRRRLQLIQRKRKRLTRVKMERQEEKKKQEERIQELHDKLDKWRQQQTEKLEEIKKEKEMKATADATLSEVRRKLAEVKKNQQVLEALEKLRQIRKENHSKQGQYTRLEEDRAFEERVTLLRTVLAHRTAEYEAEEKTLQVMLATEQEESKEKERERIQEFYLQQVEACRQETMEYLFGPGDDVKPGDVLYPFRQFYNGAANSLNGLVSIRHDWDVHLVAENDRDGSTLPVGYVTPSPPSSKTWASALVPAYSASE